MKLQLADNKKGKVLSISDDENEGKKIKDTNCDIKDDTKEDKKIKSFKRNVFIINEEKNEFLGKNEREAKNKKPRFEKIKSILAKEEFNKKNCEKSAKFERTYSNESISSMDSCSSKISVKSENSDFININDLFSKPSVVKGNILCKRLKFLVCNFLF